jgi:hypothetical protein
LIFFTRSIRDLATSQNWFLSIWNQLDMNGQVTSFAYFVFFCFWEFLPTLLLLCLITTKAGGVGAPRHGSFISHTHKLPDFGIFHIINTGGDKPEGKLLASPLNRYGTTTIGNGNSSSFQNNPQEKPRWTHGGDLFQDPLRYDSDDGIFSPHGTSVGSIPSDSSLSNFPGGEESGMNVLASRLGHRVNSHSSSNYTGTHISNGHDQGWEQLN